MPLQFEAARILVVDDTEANRDLISRRLVKAGHLVEAVDGGARALERLRADAFDVVLLDIMMPDMNGYETLAALKGDAVLRHIPVIMITAIDDMESVVRCIEMGAEDHLPKPFNPALLRARIDASLARKRLRDREQVHARSLERELEIGRDIQGSFLPDCLPRVEGWEASVCFRPARQVAGDFYDAFTVAGASRLVVLVADVCGKGVGAAVFMAALRTAIRTLIDHSFRMSPAGDDDAAQLVRLIAYLNEYIITVHGRTNMFTTIFVGVLAPSSGRLTYVNAGHDAPVVVADGIQRLEPTGPALGLSADLSFAAAAVTLNPGDVLLAFTDGVIDARNGDGVPFAEEGLLRHVAGKVASAAALVAGIQADMARHVGDAEPFDDVTMLALRRDDGILAVTAS
jgi:phosphoserine phosphatase RsbU/P